MATDPFDQNENSNPFSRALRAGLVLSPIGLAGYVGYQRVSANSALNPVAAAAATSGPGRLGATGRDVGGALKKSAKDSKQNLLKHASDEIDNLLKDSGVEKLFQSVEEQRAVIQSLLSTMDDPSSGLPNEFVLSYREKLVDIARGTVTGDEAKEAITGVIRAMSDDNSLTLNARARWASNLREYRRVAPYLTPPSAALEAGEVFQPVHISELSRKSPAYKRYQALIEGLGDNGSRFVSLAQYGSGANRQIYARIYSAGGASTQGRFLGSLPLDLGQTSAGNYVSLRMNEGGTTGYRANRFMIDAEAAQRVFRSSGGKSVSVKGLRAGGAFVSLEDYFMKEFLSRAKQTGQGLMLTGGKNDFSAWQRQTLAADTRLASSGESFTGAAGMSSHIRAAAGFQHNVATVFNFGKTSKTQKQELMQKLAAVQGLETGISASRILSRGLGNETFGTIGVYEGSPLAALKSTALKVLGGNNYLEARGLFPSTSRIEQVTGREAAFVGTGTGSRMGRGGIFGAGATFGQTAGGDIERRYSNIEWSKAVTGGTNKAIVLDVAETGKLYQALEGTGAAYHLGRETVREAFTKPLLDPGSGRPILGSALFDEIVARVKPGELTTFTKEEIKKLGGFLGMGPSGLQYLADDPRMVSLRLGYKVTESGGKKRVHITGEVDRLMETLKGFSLMHKGTLQEIVSGEQANLVGEDVVKTLEGLGISERHRVYAAGDMLKKGAGFFDLQMTSAYGLVTGDKNFRKVLAGRAATQHFKYLGDSHLARVTGAVIQGLGEHVGKGVSTREAGMVLGAIYTRGEDWLKGLDKDQAVSRVAIARAVKEAMGEQLGQQVLDVASEGRALAATTYTHGTGVGDYNLGRGSVEPRFFSNLQHRLRRMGLSSTQTSDFIANIYRNKIAYGEHLTSAQGILKMAESVTGVRGATDAAEMLRSGIPTYGLGDLSTIAPEVASGGMESFMARHQQGFLLDLTQGADTPARRAIAASAADVFKQGQIFIPGAEVLGAMRGTMIKTATGDVPIEDEYSRMVKNFVENITTLSTNTDLARKTAAKDMEMFKTNVLDMSGKIIHQVTSGKVRGMQAQVAAVYDLTKGTGFSSQARAQLAQDIFKKTRGMSVHMDTKGFLSQLTDFMGGNLSVNDAARKAEMFFTSLEGATDPKVLTHRAKGIVGLASRHPLLSLGNIAPVQIFRHVEEAGRGTADEAFSAFIQTDAGKQYANMKGFHHVADQGAKFRQRFFKDFVRSMDQFSGRGGGRTFLPRMMEDIHYLGADGSQKTLRVDLGVSGAAIGDWDGDQYQMLMVNEDSGRSIMSTLKSSKERSTWLTADNVYKMKSEIFASEAKAGLKKHEIEMEGKIGFADVERLQQNLMKEYGSKDLVGSLDVRLNKIRTAILDMSLKDPKMASQAEEALALLKTVQEHAVIKGKKLPVFKAFADMLSGSVDSMFDGAGSASFRRVMREEIFPGSQLLEGGFQVIGGGGRTVQSREAVESLAGGVMRLDPLLDFIDTAVNRAKNTGVSDYPSAARLAMAMGSNDMAEVERAFLVLRSMQTQQGGVIAGFAADPMRNVASTAEHAMTSIRSAAQRLDRKTQGLIAMGGMAALGIGAMISNEGYGPEPLTGDMEVISKGTQNAIAAGSLLQQRNVGPRPEEFQRGIDPYATQGRPVNIPTAYMNQPSSYQVRGQIYGDSGIGSIGNYMSTIGSGGTAGSVRINDARRPITQNYVDRLTGEY